MREKSMRLSRNVLLLGAVSFLNDLSSEVIIPILPLFIVSLGGGGAVIGVVGGLRESLSSLTKVLFGHLSDRSGKRKVFVFSGYLTSSVFKLLLTLSRAWQHVVVFTSFERLGKGMRTAPRDAIISESMPRERGRGFGIHRALDTSGAVLGSVVVLFLLYSRLTYREIILVAAALAFLSLLPLISVKEVRGEGVKTPLLKGLRSLPAPLKKFILAASVFSLANFSYMFFILRVSEAFPGRLSQLIPVLLYLIFNIFYAALSIPFGRLSDRVGRIPVICSGYLLFSLTSFGFIYARGLFTFALLFSLYGVVFAIVDGNQRALVSDLSSGELRGTALGTYHTAVGLSALPASILAGILWEMSSVYTFLYGGVVAFASSLLLFVVSSRGSLRKN